MIDISIKNLRTLTKLNLLNGDTRKLHLLLWKPLLKGGNEK